MIQFSEIKILDINLNKSLFKYGVEDEEKVCKKNLNSARQKLKEGSLICCRNGWFESSVQAPCSLFRHSQAFVRLVLNSSLAKLGGIQSSSLLAINSVICSKLHFSQIGIKNLNNFRKKGRHARCLSQFHSARDRRSYCQQKCPA